jgi:hypothetical protein
VKLFPNAADGLAVDADSPANLGVAGAGLDEPAHFCPARHGSLLRTAS